MSETASGFRRPRSLSEMAELRARLDRRASRAAGLAYRPAPDEVLIATFPKCGTTWLQQMVHAIRTRGDMTFDEITEVVPWLEMASLLGVDVRAPQVAWPRAFKTHLTWEEIPKGARYLHATRDPKDVVVSSYHFLEGWHFEPGAIDIDEYAEARFLRDEGEGGYWRFLLSWWSHRHDENVLFLTYEDMRAEPEKAVRRIAAHMGCDMDPELEAIVLERSSFTFMKAHEHQFDDHLVRTAFDRLTGLPPGGDSSKVRAGRVGSHVDRLSARTVERLEERWHDTVRAVAGLESYAALREALASGA